MGVDNIPMTRNWPMKSVAGEEQDHPHHRSLWYAHGDVNGIDFWSDAPKAGKIVHDRFLKLSSGKDSGLISARNRWIAPDGKCIMVDERNLRFSALESGRAVDFDITLKAENGEVTLGDTKEGTMALRLAETLRLKGKTATGHIINSAGVTDDATWGKRAEWCDYTGEVNGHKVGVAIFDHSSNPLHPTWWHVRDYGLFAANPFGVHDFEKKEKGAGDQKIPAGQSLTFKYRFYFHRDGPAEAKVSELYKQYIQTVNKP
jgi:hypothetical protein